MDDVTPPSVEGLSAALRPAAARPGEPATARPSDPAWEADADERFSRWLADRLAFSHARDLLIGLTGCTARRAGQAILGAAAERGVPPGSLATQFLEDVGRHDDDAEDLVVRLVDAACEDGSTAPGDGIGEQGSDRLRGGQSDRSPADLDRQHPWAVEPGPDWPSGDPAAPLSLSVPIVAGDLTGVTVTGELDLATAPMLHAAVAHAYRAVVTDSSTAKVFFVSLTDLSFLDAAGLRALAHVAAETRAHGDQLRVATPAAGEPRWLLRLAVTNGWLDPLFAPGEPP